MTETNAEIAAHNIRVVQAALDAILAFERRVSADPVRAIRELATANKVDLGSK